jgi:ubiquinone/menaquinone biosynthesis C-methylase UbiE
MSGEDRFERWSPAYERSVLQRLLFDRVHAAIFLAAGSTMVPAAVLDVGCGTGRLLREAHRRWPDATVVGVDISPGMIAEARRRATYGQFVVGPAEHLPLESESVDLALSTMSFHHWTDKEAGVREVARVLKTDGRFILADHAARWVRRVGAAPAPSARERIQVFTAAGLSVVEERSVLSHFLLLTVGRKRARPKSAPVEEPPAV